jgi:hypothetical protein
VGYATADESGFHPLTHLRLRIAVQHGHTGIMLIQKEDRLSRPTEPVRRSDHSRRRPPLNWQKIVRLVLYGMLGLLAGAAALACAALLLDRGGSPSPHPVEPASVAAPPPQDALAPPPPAAAPAPTPAPAAAPTPPESSELTALQAKIREADARLAALQAEAEKARLAAAEATRQREAAEADAARQRAAAAAAANDDRRTAAEASQAQHERDAAEAEQRQRQAQQAQERADAAWKETERRIQALAQPPAALPPAPAPVAANPPEPSDADAAMIPPPPPGLLGGHSSPPAARPTVVLHYRGGSRAAQQEATDIAQRLLFSDFAYSDTRSAGSVPPVPTVRYFYPDDAAAAARLAASLAWTGQQFEVQDASAHPHGAAPGTLEVWIGG